MKKALVKTKPGFTLSEVLITLGIIGVVVAIVIPSLVTNIQKRQLEASVKKFYSDLYQQIKMSEVEYDDLSGWDYTLTNKEFVKKYLPSYAKYDVNKNSKQVNDKLKYKYLIGYDIFTECSSCDFQVGKYAAYYTPSGILYVGPPSSDKVNLQFDINGEKKPNMYGKDIFFVAIYPSENTFRPMKGKQNGCVTDKYDGYYNVGKGYDCLSVIKENGWSLPKDYPW